MNRPAIDQLSSDIQEYIISLEKIVEENNNRIQDLEIMLQNMQRMLFGRKSEKAVPQVPVSVGEQLNVFNEAEESADPTVPDPLVEEVEVAAHKRKKSSRKEKFGNFPVIAHEYMLGEEEQNCDRCGSRMEQIGRELAKAEFEFIPAHIEKHEYYRAVYGCSSCEHGTPTCEHCMFASEERCAICPNRPKKLFKKTLLPAQLRYPFLKHSYASPSTVAQVIYAKYVQAIPLERQVKDWERLEFPMSKATLCNWVLETDEYYGKPLVEYMHRQLLKSNILHCDETPVQVVREEHPDRCHMWVFRSGESEKKQIVIFNYEPSRAGECATRFLDGYKNYFVSDGYAGYNRAGNDGIRCGCWIHMRRKFIEASPDKKMLSPSKAKTGYDLIMNTGLRLGEALALQWSDVNWKKNTISVSKNLIRVKNRSGKGKKYKLILQEKPKTEKSKRIIPLNKAALTALEDLKTAPGYKPDGFIIHSNKGTAVLPRTLEQTLENMCAAVGIRKVGVHALRHTYATRLFEKGVDIKIISELLGHSSTEITYRIYVHVIDSLKESAVEALDLD